MKFRTQAVTRSNPALSVQVNSTLTNTLLLLSLTLLFSGATAYWSMTTGAGHMGLGVIFVQWALIFAIQAFRNSAFGIVLVFAFTGFTGYTLGPLLNMYLRYLPHASAVITLSLFGTGVMFALLTAYAMMVQERLNYLSGFLSVGSLTVFALALLNLFFFQLPLMSLLLSSGILLLSSGWILYEISAIMQGDQRNYILATVAIYVQLYNMFVSLLNILGRFSSSKE